MSGELIGRRVACVTNYGDVYTGTMTGVDGQHNVALADVVISAYPTGSKVEGAGDAKPLLPATSQGPISTMFVRGSTILYIDVSA